MAYMTRSLGKNEPVLEKRETFSQELLNGKSKQGPGLEKITRKWRSNSEAEMSRQLACKRENWEWSYLGTLKKSRKGRNLRARTRDEKFRIQIGINRPEQWKGKKEPPMKWNDGRSKRRGARLRNFTR